MCMPIELWLLVGVLLLLVALPLVTVWIDMVSTGLGTTEQVLAVSWLIGLILMLAMPLKYANSIYTPNVKVRGAALLRRPS